jgi:HEAT repeat protein
LFAGLQSADRRTRITVLCAVSQHPALALAFGLHEELDVIDILLDGARRDHGHLEWLSWVTALAGFRDRRVTDFFIELLLTAANPDLLSLAGEYLREEPVGLVRMRAGAALFDNDCPHRVRTVAGLIQKAHRLSLPEQIRINILSETGYLQIPAFESAPDVWLAELKGPFAIEARAALETQGPTVIQALLARWNELPEQNREWLLAWSVEAGEPFATNAIHLAVGGSEELVAMALEAAADLGLGDEAVNGAAIQHLRHPEARLRRLAYRIAHADIDWHTLVSSEPDPAAAAVCVARMAECNRGTATRESIDCLRDRRWQVRAAACNVIASSGPTVINEVCPLLHDSDENVRIAVASILVGLGEATLLERLMAAS